MPELFYLHRLTPRHIPINCSLLPSLLLLLLLLLLLRLRLRLWLRLWLWLLRLRPGVPHSLQIWSSATPKGGPPHLASTG